jgi:ABC-type polysaccharide/polyol phosphate transport system ATPase subunit
MKTRTRSAPGAEETAATRSPVVSAAHVSKAFKLPHIRSHTLKERMLHPLRSRSFDVLQAVDDVSVEISPGEFFGIVGRNGSGKSTLLKCMAGIYDIDHGELRVRGRLSPFIELGVGFNADLTARDNVMINAIMLGLTRKQVRERFDQIIDFAELEDFLDLKLKNYSSGMSVRLAFSVAIQVEAEVLLIDEVLAVGDASFQQKCFLEFERLKAEGRTIVFVTHDMSAVERFCDRAMLLEKGRMVAIGEPSRVARRYIELNVGHTVHRLSENGASGEPAPARPAAAIMDAWFEDGNRTRIAELAYGEPCEVCFEVQFIDELTDPVFGATLRNEWGGTIFATTTEYGHGPTGHFRPGESVNVRLRFDNRLAASRYSVTPSIARSGAGAEVLVVAENVASLVIEGGPHTGGVVDLQHSFEIEHL